MKIIHLILGKANPNRMNGVNKVIHNLASAQSRNGMQVEVWGITGSVSSITEHQHKYVLKQFRKNTFRFLPIMDLKKEICNIEGESVFHIHGGFIFEFYWAAQQLKDLGIPYVFTSHGAFNTVALEKNKLAKQVYYLTMEKYVVRHAKAVHLIGKSEYDALGEKAPFARRVLIPNGQLIDESIVQKSEVNKSEVNFGFMGRITAHTKGLDLLLKGFAQFVSQNENPVRLTIMGDGPDLNKIKQLASELGIVDAVTFTGAKFGNEKEALLREMDYFLHPSRNEGMPGAVLEAAALGIPCIVSDETNVKEYIDKYQAGIGLKKNTVEQICKAMEAGVQIVNNNNWNEFSQNAVAMVKQEFDWNIIAERFWEVYRA